MNWYKISCNYKYARGYYGSWANAFWIAPDGEAFDTGGLTHQGWIGESSDLLYMNYDIDFPEKIDNLVSEEACDEFKERLKTLRESKEELLSEGNTEGFQWHWVTEELEELEQEDAIHSYEEGIRDNFNMTRWSEYVVRELLQEGWVRGVDKGGKLHIEVNDFEGNKPIQLASDYLFSLDLDPKKIIRFEVGSAVTDFSWGEFLNSGNSLMDFIGAGRAWKTSHFR